MALRRTSVLYIVIGFASVFAIGGWLASSRIQSPADVAARTAPPVPSPILVPVEKRVLSSNIITRGTARFGLPQPLSVAPSTLKPDPGLIARLPLPNTQFKEGDVILTASGRPLFVLQGAAPAYRDLVPGISGDDVRQLEEGLDRLGFAPGPVDGVYDERTSKAVARWYASSGWEPFGPTRAQQERVQTLEKEWGSARKRQLAAAAAAVSAVRAVDATHASAEAAVQAAAGEVAAQRMALAKLKAEQTAGSPLAVETARITAEHANKAAEAEVAAQINSRNFIVLDPRQPETARAAAEARLELARVTARKIKLEGEMALRAAEQEADLAASRLDQAEARVASALAAEKVARLDGDIAIQAALDASRVAQLEAELATTEVNRLADDLARARARIGIQMPADEIVFVRALPVRVKETSAKVGDPARGTVMAVTDNQLAVDSSLPLDAAPLVKPGMAVRIDEQALGIRADGEVAYVAGTPGTRGVDGYHIYFEVRVTETSARLEGVSLRLTIAVKSTGGAVTVVPISALSLAADGTSRVQAEIDGALKFIVVEPGLSADGYVAITPVDQPLVPDQLVVVGYDNPENGIPQ